MIFRREISGGNVEEGRFTFRSDSLGQHGFSRSRWTKEKNTLRQLHDLRTTERSTRDQATFHGRRIPLKKSGIYSGRTTASWRSFFAAIQPATSDLKERESFYSVSSKIAPTIAHWDLSERCHVPILPPDPSLHRRVDISSPAKIQGNLNISFEELQQTPLFA